MYGEFGMGFGGVFMWLFWILVILAIVWAVRAGVGGAAGPASRSPREILDERFARGEIDEEEYRRGREQLDR